MNTPWHGQVPEESKSYRIVIYSIILIFLLTLAIDVFSLFRRAPQILWFSLVYVYPLIFLSIIIYYGVKSRDEKKRLKALADIIDRSTFYLTKSPPNFHEFDKTFSAEISSIDRGPVSLFAFSIALFLDLARSIIMQEYTNIFIMRHNIKHIQTKISEKSLAEELFSHLNRLEFALRNADKMVAYDTLGNMFAFLLVTRRRLTELKAINFPKSSFLERCERISYLLKRRNFHEADSESRDLLNVVRSQSIPDEKDLSEIGWQSIITYWIWIRIAFIKHPAPVSNRLGFLKLKMIGPSKVLANQIDAIIYLYSLNDYRSMTDLIIASFDWRIQLPNFIPLSAFASNS